MSTTELRQARERLGLSLRDVANRTRIRITILDAIENRDATRLPPPIFTRGFVKAYAREVGLDPEAMAARYAPAIEPAGAPHALRGHLAADDRDGLSERESSSLVTAALIVVAGLVFVLTGPWKTASPPADNTAATTTVATAADTGGVGAAVATTGETRPAPRTLNMRIELAPRAECWVEATADGDRIIYKLLNTGDRYAIEGYEDLILRVGEPSALVYSIDGAQGRPLGPAGRPATVHITRENRHTFLPPHS